MDARQSHQRSCDPVNHTLVYRNYTALLHAPNPLTLETSDACAEPEIKGSWVDHELVFDNA